MIDQKVSKYLGPLSLLKNWSVTIGVLYFKTKRRYKQTLFVGKWSPNKLNPISLHLSNQI